MLPKLIHHIVGPNKNKIVLQCLNSWEVLIEQGYEIMIWDDNSLSGFISENYPFALSAFSTARNHAEAADIGRYLVVYHFGGHYYDWDIQLLEQDLFLNLSNTSPNGFLLEDPTDGSIASEAFSAMKAEPYLISLVRDIVGIYNSGMRDEMRTLYYSGPFRMRDALKIHQNSSQKKLAVLDVFLYDYHQIKEMPDKHYVRPMIHYWLHSWIPKPEEVSDNTTESQINSLTLLLH